VYELTVLSHFAAAHRIRCLHGKCEQLHGHNWKIEVRVASKRLRREGLVIDFGVLKQKVEKVLKTLDHNFLNDLPPFLKREPSSENIAKYIFDALRKEFKGNTIVLKKVTAWESETACASYLGRSA
jgi:6-pyruvoyltetrahydropterin/6-carboxytetrahydropterin synthase